MGGGAGGWGEGGAEDWRMAVVWGRTLVCIADAKVSHPLSPSHPSSHPFAAHEPRPARSSPLGAIAAARPPVTRRMALAPLGAHEVLRLAADQFVRGVFHMPHGSHFSHSSHFSSHSSSPLPSTHFSLRHV